MTAGLGKRIESISEAGIPVFRNSVSGDKWVGEIDLVKNEQTTICNLCRKPVPKLTEDHVPPQCMGNKGTFHYINYLNFTTKRVIDYYGICQGGIKYRTVCSKCNNEELKRYDDHIGPFCRELERGLEQNSEAMSVKCCPYMVIKGLVGHFLSATLANSLSAFEMQMLAYFWDDKRFADDLRIYLLPYEETNLVSVIREVVWNSLRQPDLKTVVNSVKCRPLGFFMMFGGFINDVEPWNKYLYDKSETTVNISYSKKVDKWFPENYTPPYSGKLFGHNAAHSIIAFREIEQLP